MSPLAYERATRRWQRRSTRPLPRYVRTVCINRWLRSTSISIFTAIERRLSVTIQPNFSCRESGMLETVAARLARAVTPQVMEDYHRDGAVCIRQIFTQEEVALLREGIDINLRAPSPRAKVASHPTIRAGSSK